MTVVGDQEVERFADQGFLVLRGFFDVKTEIEPVRRGIHEIIGLVAESHGVPLERQPFDPEHFDDGYSTLRNAGTEHAGAVYDAVKQLAPFVRLVASQRHEDLFRQLRATDLVGIAGGGSGIRIDNPADERFSTWWHQEYPAQLRSLDGLVLWSPLRRITPELGPLEVSIGSHRDGLIPVLEDPADGRSGAYALRLRDEDAVAARHPTIAPLVEPGDLIVLDFLTVHRSGRNVASVPRWTLQFRYFNFRDRVGRSIDWAGAYAAGRSIQQILTDLEVD